MADALSLVRAEDLVAELQDLLRVPSVTGTAAESEAQHRVEARMRGVGQGFPGAFDIFVCRPAEAGDDRTATRLSDFADGRNTRTGRTYRIANEAPTLLLLLIVVMVIVKPF